MVDLVQKSRGSTSWDAHTRTSYDAAGRIARVYTAHASNNSDRVSDLSYTYTSNGTACSGGQPAGTDTALRQSMTDHTTGLTTTYCYDTANRLTSATTPGGDTFTYTYDANGNRTQQTKNGAVVQTLTVNAADQLTSSGYSYDATGNLLTASGATATYNGAEQMTDLNFSATTTTYTYAGTDQTELVSQTRAGSTRTYTYGRTDSNGLPLIEAVTSGTTTSYIAHDPTGSPIALIDSTGRIDYYALDGLGSTVATVDQDGITTGKYSYDPYGNTTVTSPTGSTSTDINPYRYAGGTYDPFGLLVHFGQRWYDPTTGRFTQQDALETLADPTRANRYEYANSNPINYIDPTGKAVSGTCAAAGVAGGILGGAIGLGVGVFLGSAGGPVGEVYGGIAGTAAGATAGADLAVGACEGGGRGAGESVLSTLVGILS